MTSQHPYLKREMQPLDHTGDSANIAFYAEQSRDPAKPGYVWVEVLRRDHTPRNGRLVPCRPVFHVRVCQYGTGEIGQFDYEPATRPAPGPLPTRTVARLVRDYLSQLANEAQ